jgi:predicted ATPase
MKFRLRPHGAPALPRGARPSGDVQRGIALLSRTIATLEATHAHHFMSYLLGLLADAHLKAGSPTEAMKAVERGLALHEDDGERYFIPELQRLKGELLARPPYEQPVQAEAVFRRAIKIADEHGAWTLQKRAKESLQRWRDTRR